MQVVAVQLDIAWEDKAASCARAHELVAAARPEPGALVVLPEMFATGFSMKVPRIAEGEERAAERFLAALAREFGVYVTGGVVNRAADGRGLNESLTIGPDGRELARYAKCHPFSFAGEDRHYAKGTEPLCWDWSGITVAPVVCYDLRFPELFRHAVRRGAQLYTVIANWPAKREAHWLTLLRARAIENQAWVVGVNRSGDDPWLHYPGRSLIVDPYGEVLADAGSAAGCIAAAIDPAALAAYRTEFPALADLRPEFLGG